MDGEVPRKGETKYGVQRPQYAKYEASSSRNGTQSYWKTMMSKLDHTSHKSSAEKESAQISEVLPEELYRSVCRALDLPVSPAPAQLDAHRRKKSERPQSKRSVKTPLLSYRKSFTVQRDLDSDTDVEVSPRGQRKARPTESVHSEFLARGLREQVTWASHYLQPEREDEKGLVKKANDLTDKIAEEFCSYMRQLGGAQPSALFTPNAIKELFQIEFDTPATRGLRIIDRELSSVPSAVAAAHGAHEKSDKSLMESLIESDLRAAARPNRITAFGRSLPQRDQWRAPSTRTRSLWRSATHVPRDLVTLKTVWDGITNLRSVKEYCRWMIEHPEFRRPPFLKSMGMFDLAALDARLTVESARPSGQSGRADDSTTLVGPLRKSGDPLRMSEEQTGRLGDETVRLSEESRPGQEYVFSGEDAMEEVDVAPIVEIRRRLSELVEDDQ